MHFVYDLLELFTSNCAEQFSLIVSAFFYNGIIIYYLFISVAHIMLLAHAKAWHTYDQGFRATQQGKLSIILNVQWGEPKTDKQTDLDAAERYLEWFLGWFANPVFVNGDWPEVMKMAVLKNSESEGIPNRYALKKYISLLHLLGCSIAHKLPPSYPPSYECHWLISGPHANC